MDFRTDLALERRDLYRKANNVENEVNGIQTRRRKRWRRYKNNKS